MIPGSAVKPIAWGPNNTYRVLLTTYIGIMTWPVTSELSP